MATPSENEKKGYWRIKPLGAVSGRLAYEDHLKEMTTWSRADFMTRKFEDAPKDGAFDDAPPTWWRSTWNQLRKALRRSN